MQSIKINILIILAACVLPYIFAFIARKVSGYQFNKEQTIRDFYARQTGLAARANAVQQNSFENLPLFIAAMLMAEYLVVRDVYVHSLGILYVLLRICYGAAYLLNFNVIRSLLWLLATACPVLLLLLCLQGIH